MLVRCCCWAARRLTNLSKVPYVTTLIPLGTSQPFATNMDKAELIMNATPGVQQLDYSSQLHVSVNCMHALFSVVSRWVTSSVFLADYCLLCMFEAPFAACSLGTTDFCCLYPQQITQLSKVLASIRWSPFNITFGKAECNTNGDPWNLGGISFIVWLDPQSQVPTSLGSLFAGLIFLM
jgi:hypothetical protein